MQEKIVFLDGLTLGKNTLKAQLEKSFCYVEYPSTEPSEILERAMGARILLTNKVVLNRGILEGLKDSLKLICITATGMNNVDLEAAKTFGIAVKNVAGYSTQSVAQHTLMMVLALSAKLPFYDNYCKSGAYARSPIFTNLSEPLHLIANKQWGIIGLGSIGERVATLAEAFGARVSYYSTSGKNANTKYPRKPLESLLKESQILSIHAPLNANTQNLLNAQNLKLLQQGAILISAGRGGIINEQDLANVLESHAIYVGLDVFEKEPINKDNPLLHPKFANQLILTPHLAWGYEESKAILEAGILKNILEFTQQNGI